MSLRLAVLARHLHVQDQNRAPLSVCRKHTYASDSAHAVKRSSSHAEEVLASKNIVVDIAGFHKNGYGIVRNFASAAECDAMRAKMHRLIRGWKEDKLQDKVTKATFTTDESQIDTQGSSDYFLDSADRIHFFEEPVANADVDHNLNKVGHGLHLRDPTFRAYSQSEKVAALTRVLGWQNPVLPQSMYIFKQARIGGSVTSHQDSSFLFTEPRQTCLGLWLALEDATLTNGCIWGRPGSHREPVRRRLRRNPEYFAGGRRDVPQTIFEQLVGPEDTVSWEGAMPGDMAQARRAGFVPLPCKKGDLLLIHGQVDHLSFPNTSPISRDTFQLHLVEGPRSGVRWSEGNWLQYPEGETFPELRLE